MLFFELIQVAIGKRACLSHTPSEQEWLNLYDLAEKQSLVGVCFTALEQLFTQEQMPEIDLVMTWLGQCEYLKSLNKIVDKQCDMLETFLQKDGFRSCIIKGHGVANLYDEKLRNLRNSGDIDVWIDGTREQVIDYVMKYEATSVFDQKHIRFHFFEDTEVEAHWIPVKRCSPKIDKILLEYFDSERERQFSNVVNGICFPTVDFQLVHQLLHVYGHYLYEGVGLRQIMDLYYAQLACLKEEEVRVPDITQLFKRLGLMKFVAASQWVLHEVFGLDRDKMICEPDASEGQQLLDEIMIGGNFGKYDERNKIDDETVAGRFWRRWIRRYRLFRYDPLGTILMPYQRLILELWMIKIKRQYCVK